MNQIVPINTTVPQFTVSVEFPERKLLPKGGSSPDEQEATLPSIPEVLIEEDTKWEPKLDKADRIDCSVAAACGVATGLIDIFYVGKFSLDRANEWGANKVEQLVIKVAQLSGYKGDDLDGAIKYLENAFPMAADGNTNDFGGGKQHHLRDFSHHFSLGGLVCSMFTQFTGKVIGTDEHGALKIADIPENKKALLGKNLQEKIFFGTVLWAFHIASDMAGSSSSNSGGTGVPGPIMSLIKQLSALPIFKDAQLNEMGLRKFISKLFNGTLLARRDKDGKILEARRFDLRTEIGIVHEVGRQAIPIIVNQCLIRSFYFVRRFVHEINALQVESVSDLSRIAPEDVLPFKNHAIGRMSTISTGVFSAVDIVDALVRAAIVSRKDEQTSFLGEFITRVNFVGIGTFAVACSLDVKEVLAQRGPSEKDIAEERLEKELSNLGCLELDSDKVQILQSILRLKILHDIDSEGKDRRRNAKQEWYEEWLAAASQGLGALGLTPGEYFLDSDALYSKFNALVEENRGLPWPFLVAMEADLEDSYSPLGGDNDKAYKGLKLDSDYMVDVFAVSQATVTKDDLEDMRKAYKKAKADINASASKNVLKVAGTIVIVGVAAGAAFLFAPIIAPIIAGEAVAGLSGAALTSASLAFVGGGALAAGGAGMAGGTAIIAGGGALLGAVGGTGASVAFTVATGSDGYVYQESSKLLCYCRDVLIDKYDDPKSVQRIHVALSERIVEMEIELATLRHRDDQPEIIEDSSSSDKGKDTALSTRKKARIIEKSIKYMRRCDAQILKYLPTD